MDAEIHKAGATAVVTTRRGSRGARHRNKHKRICRREPCRRYCHSEHAYCSSICRVWAEELEHLERIVSEAGIGKIAGEAWATAVQINDLISDHHNRKTLLRNVIKQQSSNGQSNHAESKHPLETSSLPKGNSELPGQSR